LRDLFQRLWLLRIAGDTRCDQLVFGIPLQCYAGVFADLFVSQVAVRIISIALVFKYGDLIILQFAALSMVEQVMRRVKCEGFRCLWLGCCQDAANGISDSRAPRCKLSFIIGGVGRVLHDH
jgi:hypothetical protein